MQLTETKDWKQAMHKSTHCGIDAQAPAGATTATCPRQVLLAEIRQSTLEEKIIGTLASVSMAASVKSRSDWL